MFGRRERQGRVAYPDDQDVRDQQLRTTDDHELDQPDHYDGPVHRRDESELRPANIDGTPPGIAPVIDRQREEERTSLRGQTRPDLVIERTVTARGGLMPGPVVTGMVVSFGSMAILTAVIAALFVASDTTADEATSGTAIPIGIGALLVLTQFISYMWGGYTAGRMARGSGVMNGLAVPMVALLLALGTGAVMSMMGADFNFSVPVIGQNLSVAGDTVWQIGIGLGIASLLAMIAGGILGGVRGARWHTKLEAGTVRGHRTEVEA